MTNGFYSTDGFSKTKIMEVFKDAVMYSYSMEVQRKYHNKNTQFGSREIDETSSVQEIFKDMREPTLAVVDRFMYSRGQVATAKGEICIHSNWNFIYLYLSLSNLKKLVRKHKLKLKRW